MPRLNTMQEFVDTFDYVNANRRKVYANCRVRVTRSDIEACEMVKCRGCHKPFVPEDKNQVYCSPDCKKVASKIRRIKSQKRTGHAVRNGG